MHEHHGHAEEPWRLRSVCSQPELSTVCMSPQVDDQYREQLLCLEVEEARIEASAKRQDLYCGDALSSKVGVEVLQDLPEGKYSREVSCGKIFAYRHGVCHVNHQ